MLLKAQGIMGSEGLTDLHRFREQFPALANKIYFNYGGQGPMSQTALDAITQAQTYIQQIGPFGNEVNHWINEEVKATRAAIASAMNVPPETITITEDVTVGCNIAMWGIEWPFWGSLTTVGLRTSRHYRDRIRNPAPILC